MQKRFGGHAGGKSAAPLATLDLVCVSQQSTPGETISTSMPGCTYLMGPCASLSVQGRRTVTQK
ncbi:predicted protein [Plenodomus lingam JN3]|uniref:Predicted protein n=1 Tax=Leptosphaeria maculans (strain JN3 / isolate v23.1.3 / race Av1-4-5-6-7-8) TaxID=985895 RepID=E4ZTT5_LEPMJ|nr:predicted protein [Plenodomus lingam JN3]CBX94645.1 predicted protein [Plenodomus lingam JN3]